VQLAPICTNRLNTEIKLSSNHDVNKFQNADNASATSITPDLERFELRRFLQSLGPDEFELKAGATNLSAIAAILEGNPKAVLFEQPAGESTALCGNLAGSRNRLAQAFDTTSDHLLQEVLKRLRVPGQVVSVPRAAAPVQQVVLTGDECDFTKLPVHLQHGLDGAPYISSSIDFSVDATTGWTNVGVRRLMLRGRRTAGIDLIAPSDLRAIYLEHAGRGERLPIAFAIGTHPIDHVAATMRMPTDELELLASLRGAPLGVVKCITNDLMVPADAQYILEGYLDPAGHVEPEGPYGEFLGYYGGVKRNPLFHLTAITHRRDAVFQTSTISGRDMATTDTAQLCAPKSPSGARWKSPCARSRRCMQAQPAAVCSTCASRCSSAYRAKRAMPSPPYSPVWPTSNTSSSSIRISISSPTSRWTGRWLRASRPTAIW
jgi:2,5-furandicarboxylate decarboxylase 1